MLTVACAATPFTVTWVDVQAGAGEALVEIAQLRLTVPAKPPDGVMVVVNVAEPPGATVAEAGFGVVSEKLAPAITVKVTVTEWESAPDVPVTAMG